MEINELLKKIGLNAKETGVYIALIENGPMTVSGIAKASGLHRPAIYQVLPNLEKRGLVTISPKGKLKHYGAESPEKLKNMINELSVELDNILPDLKSSFNRKQNKPIVKFLEGSRGITFIMEDLVHSLKKGDTFYRYSSRKSTTSDEKYLPRDYKKIRDQKQLERFVITSEALSSQKKPSLDRAIKIVPEKYGLFDYDITQIIYGDKVAFIDYNTETAFLIENPIIAEFQKKIFKMLFDLLPGGLK